MDFNIFKENLSLLAPFLHCTHTAISHQRPVSQHLYFGSEVHNILLSLFKGIFKNTTASNVYRAPLSTF